MNIIEILTVILVVLASALCIALFNFRYQIGKSVHSINANIQELSSQLKPLLKSTHKILNKLSDMTNGIEPKLQTLRSFVADIRECADKILKTEAAIRGGVEYAAIMVLKNFHAAGKGVESFWRNYQK